MRVLLVDGFNLVRRLYEARPHDDAPVDEELISNAAHSLQRALHTHQPSHACCVFDSHAPTWRHRLYPAYKANRKPTPPALLAAIPRFDEAFLGVGVRSVCVEGYESDDVIATMKKGQMLTIQAINMQGTPISLPLPLADFAKAYEGPATDPKAFEDQQRKLQEELQKKAEEARKKLEGQQPAAQAPAAAPAQKK